MNVRKIICAFSGCEFGETAEKAEEYQGKYIIPYK